MAGRYEQTRNILIYHYNILCNGKHVECNLLGWRTAHAHAKKYLTNLFEKNYVEILCIDTGEIWNINA